MRSVAFCFSLCLFFASSSAVSADFASCPDALSSTSSFLNEFLDGKAVHEPNDRLAHALDAQAIADMEIDLLAGQLGTYALTSMGRARIGWLLRNPLLNREEIIARQSVLKELLDPSQIELRKSLEGLVAAYANYENRTTSFENWIRRRFGSFAPPFAPRPIMKYFQTLSESEGSGLAPKLHRAANYVIPFLYPALILGNRYVSSDLVFIGNSLALGAMGYSLPMQRERRAVLTQFKAFVRAAFRLETALANASSPDLQRLGQVLAAVRDPNHPLEVSGEARFIKRLISWPIVPAIFDFTFISNFTLLPKVDGLKKKLARFAIVASAIAELDAYLGMARAHEAKPDLVFPEILAGDERVEVDIVEGQNPYLFFRNETSVANTAKLSNEPSDAGDLPSVLFLTGPNGRGKSTFLRMVGLNVILAQNGMGVPARSMRLTPVALRTSLNSSDSIQDKESTFRHEVRRVANLLRETEKYPRSLFLLDELFTGTSLGEQVAAEKSVIRHLIARQRIAIIASHKRQLSEMEQESSRLGNIHVSDEDTRLFQIEAGPSLRYNAIEVMEEEDIPESVLHPMRRALEQ